MSPSSSGIPFWDPGIANVPASVWSALPDNESAPWPSYLSPWNTIKMAKMRAPGYVIVKGGRAKRFSADQTPGDSGALFNFYGYDYAQFSVKIHIWTPKQFEWLQRFLPLISPAPTSAVSPKAVSVDHPAMRLAKITDIFVTRVGIPDIVNNLMTIDIECVEYLATMKNAAGAGGLKSRAANVQNPDGTVTTSTLPKTPTTPKAKP